MDYPTFRKDVMKRELRSTTYQGVQDQYFSLQVRLKVNKLTYSQPDIVGLVLYTKKWKYIAYLCNLLQTLSIPRQSKLPKTLQIQEFH
jgi:hypothetical protein